MRRTIVLALAAMTFTTVLAGSTAADDWKALVDQGNAAEKSGDYARALGHYREAVRIAETFGTGDPRLPFTLNSLGMMHDALAQFMDAENAYRQALAAVDPARKPLDRAMILANLATLYIETAQPVRAENLLRESLAIHATSGEHDEVRLALTQNSLAELLTVTGKYREAEPLLTASLTVFERYPNSGTEIGIARNNLGVVRIYQGRYREAVHLLEQALSSLQAARSPDHPIVLRSLNNLAGAHYRLHQYAQADENWRHAVDLAAGQLGMEHPLYGEILVNYARFLRETGQKAKGKELESRAARILRDSRRRNGIGGVIDISALQSKSK